MNWRERGIRTRASDFVDQQVTDAKKCRCPLQSPKAPFFATRFATRTVSIRIQCAPVNSLIATPEFEQWLGKLRDAKGKARILSRLDAAAFGNFGDCHPVGESVSEMRIHFGPGYRVYLTRRGTFVYVLLIGGDKSTQKRDIKRALQMARELKT
jgi:putative addiction module killer protein